jgi:hypothetical protein
MKLKMKGEVIEEDASLPGLCECKVTHTIKDSKGTIEWVGPKIPPEVWNEILSFFKWCYDTTKSECQVRLYVSPTHKTWKAWAYPQEANTGMSAHELDNEDAKKQRAELNLVAPDWFYFGTVHHHCAISAFQSSTDAENEESQDGLHITIGNLNNDPLDIHARFYRKGLKVDPDMSWFWDVGEILEKCPKNLKKLLPKDWKDKTARSMMCQPPEVIAFPDAWKANIVYVKKEENKTYGYWSNGTWYPSEPSGTTTSEPSHFSPESDPLWKRSRAAWKEILRRCVVEEVAPEDLENALDEMKLQGFAYEILLKACLHHNVDADDLDREAPNNYMQAIMDESFAQQKEQHEKNQKESKEAEDKGKEEVKDDAYPESGWSNYA